MCDTCGCEHGEGVTFRKPGDQLDSEHNHEHGHTHSHDHDHNGESHSHDHSHNHSHTHDHDHSHNHGDHTHDHHQHHDGLLTNTTMLITAIHMEKKLKLNWIFFRKIIYWPKETGATLKPRISWL